MSLTPGRLAANRGSARSGESTTLTRYLTTVRSHLKLIVACTIIAIVGAVIYVEVATKTYTATSDVVVTPESATNTITSNLPVLQSSGSPTQDVLTAASLFHSPAIAQATISKLGLRGPTTNDLLGKVSIIPVDQSNVLAVTAVAGSAGRAQAIANSYATEIVDVRSAQLHAAIQRVLPSLRTSAAQVPAAQRYGSGSVGQTITQLQQMLAAPDPTVSVSSAAALPTAPSSPKKSLSLLAGLLVGLLVGVGAAFGLEALDPRVRSEGQLRERFPSAPVLARIPRRAGRPQPGPLTPADLSPAAMEQYRTLRTALLMDHDHPGGRAVLVASTGPSEGKSTSAVSLAAVLAQGGSRVILIDADLRRPSVADAFRVSRFKGTDDVLAGHVELSEALIPVTLGAATIDVLFSHKERAESASRLTEDSARRLVEEAKRIADFVVLDTSPLLLVSDALLFADAADDIVLVVRAEETRVSRLDKAWDLVVRQHAGVSGFIMIGVSPDRDLGYGYGPTGDSGWKPAQTERPKSSRSLRQTLEK